MRSIDAGSNRHREERGNENFAEDRRACSPCSRQCAASAADNVDGRWDAQLVRGDNVIPFRLDISGAGPTLKGTLYDGFRPYENTTSALVQGWRARAQHRALSHHHQGEVRRRQARRQRSSRRTARIARTTSSSPRATWIAPASAAANAPSIAGSWEIPLDAPSSKGEKAFRFIVEQKGAEVAASILRVDGDTGSYSGTFKDGKWVLSHFDGSRPGVIVVTPTKDGTLEIQQRAGSRRGRRARRRASSRERVSRIRAGRTLLRQARGVSRGSGARQGLPGACELPDAHDGARSEREVHVQLPGRERQGRFPRKTDFAGKVIVAIVTGTWCPNCHDEAQYLVELDKKYRDKGPRHRRARLRRGRAAGLARAGGMLSRSSMA